MLGIARRFWRVCTIRYVDMLDGHDLCVRFALTSFFMNLVAKAHAWNRYCHKKSAGPHP